MGGGSDALLKAIVHFLKKFKNNSEKKWGGGILHDGKFKLSIIKVELGRVKNFLLCS